MPKCKNCGKTGFFLKLNTSGFCKECEQLIIESRINYLKQQEIKRQEEWQQLYTLPRFPVLTNGIKCKTTSTSFIKELPYSNITAKSNSAKLGKFVVVDIETTGLSVVKNDVIEIAAIKYKEFKPVEVFHTFIFPPHGLCSEAAKVNKITENMVSDAPLLYQVLPSFQEFISGYNLVSHNFEFDFKFLCRDGLDIVSEKRKYFDTMKIAQKLLKKPRYIYDKDFGEHIPDYDSDYDVENYKLETLCDYYGIGRNEEHRALSDCYDTARLFQKLVAEKI